VRTTESRPRKVRATRRKDSRAHQHQTDRDFHGVKGDDRSHSVRTPARAQRKKGRAPSLRGGLSIRGLDDFCNIRGRPPMSEHEPKYHPGIAAAWIGVVLALSMVPLGIGILGPPPAGREFWIEFGVALGFLGMGLMCVQFLFSGRFAWVAARFGTDYVLQFHRQDRKSR